MEGRIPIPIKIPTMGERGDIPDHELPIQALRFCQNMIRSNKGRFVLRPGYQLLSSTNPNSRGMGGIYYRTATGSDRTVIGTKLGWWKFDGVDFIDITGNPLTGGDTDQVRFAVYPEGSPINYNLIGVNGVDSTKIWDGAAAAYSDLGGSPPTAIDVAVSANRVLLLVAPFTVRISGFNNSASWPADLQMILPDSGDLGVGMERLSRTTVAAYGDNSQWVINAQATTFPFRPELIDEKPGPLSAYAIVRYGGIHFYLAEDGLVYMFDGVTCRSVGEAMQNYVLTNLGNANKKMTHGFYNQVFGAIVWLFPSSTASAPDLGVYYKVATGEMGRVLFGSGLTASAEWKVIGGVTFDSLVGSFDDQPGTFDSYGSAGERKELLIDSTGKVFVFGLGANGDNGNPIEGIWELPQLAAAGVDKAFGPTVMETFFRKTTAPVDVEVSLGVNNTLAEDRELIAAGTEDISINTRKDVDFAKLEMEDTRFVTVRHRVNTVVPGVEWLGGVLRGNDSEIEGGPT